MYRGDWLRGAVKKLLRRYIVRIEFHWPTIGTSQMYRVRPLRHDELVVLIWSFYGSKLDGDQIKEVLKKLIGTGQADMKNVRSAVKHCEAVVAKMDSSWGPLLSNLVQ